MPNAEPKLILDIRAPAAPKATIMVARALTLSAKPSSLTSLSFTNALATKYNAAQIRTGLPSNPGGASENLCCQKGMVAKTTWGSQQPCANGETPKTSGTNYNCAKRQ